MQFAYSDLADRAIFKLPYLSTITRYFPLLIPAIAWEGIAILGEVPDYILPSLSSVGMAFVEMSQDDLWFHTSRSIYRGFSALAAAIILGTSLGILMAQIKPVRVIVKPFVQMFYPMPKSALIPIAIMWFGLGDSSKIV